MRSHYLPIYLSAYLPSTYLSTYLHTSTQKLSPPPLCVPEHQCWVDEDSGGDAATAASDPAASFPPPLPYCVIGTSPSSLHSVSEQPPSNPATSFIHPLGT